MSNSSAVSEEDRKNLSNLNKEIADRVNDIANIMSKYIDIKFPWEFSSSSQFGYTVNRKKNEKNEVKARCIGIQVECIDTGEVGCYDFCGNVCRPGPCGF